jgi:hypothetical protein
MFLMNFDPKDRSCFIDHEDHDSLNNRKSNLRIITITENSRHRKSKNINNSSGYRNVSWSNTTNEWLVQLQDNTGRTRVVGRFPKEKLDEAGAFATKMRQEWYGDFSGED